MSAEYNYLRFSADPTIDLGQYHTGVEGLWLDFQTETNKTLRNRTLTEKGRTVFIAKFNEKYLPNYRGLVLAVTETDEPIAYGAYAQRAREAGYTSAYVKPEHRQKGIFGKITDEVILFTKETGAKKLDTIITSKEVSIDSLLRRGFRETPPDPRRTVTGTSLRKLL